MRGEARFAYNHGIVSRKGDLLDAAWMPRGRRVSLTFRGLPRRACDACRERRPPCAASNCDCRCHDCDCAFANFCDARPDGAPKLLPTRLAPPAKPYTPPSEP